MTAQSSSSSSPPQPVLEGRGISVHYGGVTALSDIDIAVNPGEILAIIGPNGAGKTTLFGVLSGLIHPQRGKVLLNGEDVTSRTPQYRARRGLARTFQRVQIFPELTIRDHLILALHSRRGPHSYTTDLVRLAKCHNPKDRELIDRVLYSLGLTSIADALGASLPLGTARLVEVGRALACKPSVVLLDEPSSGLATADRAKLASTLAQLRVAQQVAFVLVEHDLELVLGLADRIDVLDFGERIASGTPEQIRSNPDVQQAYLGTVVQPNHNLVGSTLLPGLEEQGAATTRQTLLPASYADRSTAADYSTGQPLAARTRSGIAPHSGKEGASDQTMPMLSLEGICVDRAGSRVLSQVSFDVPARSVLAVLGANGSGKSTLGAAIAGTIDTVGGSVRISETDVTHWGAHRRVRLGLAYIPAASGTFAGLSVAENLRLSFLGIGPKAERHHALEQAFELFPPLAERHRVPAGFLSGGERQMLAVARVLVNPPRLLVADEITLGLAPKLVDLMFEALAKARAAGVTIILAEQFVERALELADQAIILQRGKVAWRGPASEGATQALGLYLGTPS